MVAARLASRPAREAEYRTITSGLGITVGDDGRCERDAGACVERLYDVYRGSLRDEYTAERPALPVLFLDGTGGSLNRGICHGTIGCADFKAVGDSDAKQSRATLQPLFLYEGSDHSAPLEASTQLAIASYNKLVNAGYFDRVSFRSDNETERIPCRPITAADMQGTKSTYMQLPCCHSVFCKCQRGEQGPQREVPDQPFSTWEEVTSWYAEVGCEFKTYDEMCAWAHYSPGVARGGAFTEFKCECCGYEPTERQWRADLAEWHAMPDEERTKRQRAHQDPYAGEQQHFHQLLYHPPLPHHGMDRAGVDLLHLIYLNLFKHLFNYTVHHNLPAAKKKKVREFCKEAGFYSYDAASDDEDPAKRWIGREVKRFLENADKYLPFLLQLAHFPDDDLDVDDNDDGYVADDTYAPTADDLAAEELEEPDMMKDAARWDRFLELVRAFHEPWPQGEEDTDEYRKARALIIVNLAAAVCKDLYELKPLDGVASWVPHILLYIVPRQMVELGDPARRSCDACESFGAMVKTIIKTATCRRRISTETQHTTGIHANRRRWRQSFTKGYIEQAFNRVSARELLRSDTSDANVAYLQRQDYRRLSTGVETIASHRQRGVAATPSGSIHAALGAARGAGSMEAGVSGKEAGAAAREAVQKRRRGPEDA